MLAAKIASTLFFIAAALGISLAVLLKVLDAIAWATFLATLAIGAIYVWIGFGLRRGYRSALITARLLGILALLGGVLAIFRFGGSGPPLLPAPANSAIRFLQLAIAVGIVASLFWPGIEKAFPDGPARPAPSA